MTRSTEPLRRHSSRASSGAADDVDAAVLGLIGLAVAATIRAGSNSRPSLSPTQIRILNLLGRGGRRGMSPSELAERLAVSRPSTTRMCQRLERDELIQRRAVTGNQVRFTLTQVGRRALAAVNRDRVSAVTALLDDLPAARRPAARRAMTELGRVATARTDLW